MHWVNLLHVYQPFNQSKEVLEKITNECYRPLFKGLLKIPDIKLNLNINAVLTEMLVKEGYSDVVENIKKLAEQGKLEFTESAKYHPLLAFLSKSDAIRQIKKNHQSNKKYFGEYYNPTCFFPPEMAYSPSVADFVSELNYKMIAIDEISYKGGKKFPLEDKLLTIRETDNLIAVFRNRRISNSLIDGTVRNDKDFKRIIKEDLKKDKYVFTAMDGETFGHHHPGLENSLFNILRQKEPEQIFFSDLPEHFKVEGETDPIKSTWASSAKDIEKGVQFYTWKDPENKVHQIQWKFLDYVLRLSNNKGVSPEVEEKIDKSLASDQFYWASGDSWWSIGMIEKGAWAVLEALRSFPNLSEEETKKGEQYYKEILATAYQWQRSGKVKYLVKKNRTPFKEKTLEKGNYGKYYAFLKILEDRMEKAAKENNYEKAIMLRNAIWKIKNKNDIYDALRIIELLRLDIPETKLQALIKKNKEKYKKESNTK